MIDKRLLLINPPFPRKVASVPLQMLYLAAAVKGTGVDVQLLDLDTVPEAQRNSVLEQILQDYKPTHVGVTAYSSNYPESLDISRYVKSFDPRIITISGGPHQIAMGGIEPEPEFIDHIVTDTFGENALLGLLGLEKRIQDRATLFPAFELLKEDIPYQFDPQLFDGRRMAQILTATGCNQGCSFCSAPMAYMPFENDAVVRQLQQVVGLGYEAVFFNDPNFTNPFRGTTTDIYSRVKDLMKAMKDEELHQLLVWGCQTKASMVNPSVLDVMAGAGCVYITYALENIDGSSLKEMVKGITPEMVKRAITLSGERGIKTGLYVMFGTNPDQEQDFTVVQDTLDFVEGLMPNYLSISILANYPMWDRNHPGRRIYTNLDYANVKYSREPIWLNFDEGWGAFHPNTSAKQARRYLTELERRRALRPQIWDSSRPKAIRRF